MTLSDRNDLDRIGLGNPRLARVGRVTFTIGSIVFLVIGAAHTATQLTTLSSPATKAAYRAGGPIEVSGQVVDGWDLFAGTSLLMGFYALAIGVLGLVALRTASRSDGLPPAAVSVSHMVLLIGIAVVGATLLGPLQLYGGLAGVALYGLAALAARYPAAVQQITN